MDRWAKGGDEPPQSRYGRIEDGTMVPPEELDFPEIPGVRDQHPDPQGLPGGLRPGLPQRRHRVEPAPGDRPRLSDGAFPQSTRDGNEIVGIQMPEHTVPLATYTGWNLFKRRVRTDRRPLEHAGLLRFRSRGPSRKRKLKDDPRPSIEERYGTRERYLGMVAEAALAMVDDGYLLAEDVPSLLKQAKTHWDYLMAGHQGEN